MAIYYNLGIDCGAEREVAEGMMRHFEGFSIGLPDTPPVVVELTCEQARGLWFVGVWPVGVSRGAPRGDRVELLSDAPLQAIEEALWDRLAEIIGYRRAMFGAEIYDMFTFAHRDEDSDIDYQGMVFAVDLFPPSNAVETTAFREGYARVTELRR